MNWIIQSITAMCLFGVMSALITFEMRKGLPLNLIMMAIGISWMIYFGFMNYKNSTNLQLSLPIIAVILLIAILSVFGNIFQFSAAVIAPNPGLAYAIVGCQSLLVAVIAISFMGDKLTLTQTSGIALSLLGIALMSTGK